MASAFENIKNIKSTSGGTARYRCAICKQPFNKTKTKKKAGIAAEFVLLAAFLIFGFLMYGIKGAGAGFMIWFVFAFIWACAIKKVCPHCNSENFYKNA